MKATFARLSPEDQRERMLQVMLAEATASARKQGKLPPIFLVPYVPRPIPHPDGRAPVGNNHRRRKRAREALKRNGLPSS
jgi:hypothetical protein